MLFPSSEYFGNYPFEDSLRNASKPVSFVPKFQGHSKEENLESAEAPGTFEWARFQMYIVFWDVGTCGELELNVP
jgi:hypothetical protein